MLMALITVALGEVLVTGASAGVDLEPLAEALSAGSGSNFVLTGYFPNTLFTEERNAGFGLSLMHKDVALFMKAAADVGMDLPLAELVQKRYTHAKNEAGLAEADSTSIAELYERAAGIRLQMSPVQVQA